MPCFISNTINQDWQNLLTFFKRFAKHDAMAATSFSNLYNGSKNCFSFGNANISWFASRNMEQNLSKPLKYEKRNQIQKIYK